MTIWFTSDTHFYHKAIIKYCNRPVPDNYIFDVRDGVDVVAAMNEWLIKRWNEKVKPSDEVYHLGDFAFCGKTRRKEIIQRLAGIKYLVRGNHDPDKEDFWKDAGFEWVKDYYKLMVHDVYQDEEDETKFHQYHQPIILCHFPILSWDNMAHGSWHLHGHCHGSLPQTKMKRMDAGVDCNNWYPISYEEVKQIMVMRSIVPVDHHGV